MRNQNEKSPDSSTRRSDGDFTQARDATEFSRRGFMHGLLVGGGALAAGRADGETTAKSSNPKETVPAFDFTRNSPALAADHTIDSACQFCNSLCGLKVSLKNGRILEVRGEPEDPVQAGELCVKAEMMTQLVYNRHRLTTPLRRVAGVKGSPDSRFEPISWNEALTLIAKKFIEIRDEGDAHTIANRTTGRMPRGTGSLVNRFFDLLGSPNATDVGPVCNDAGGNALAWTFGLGNFTNGYGVDPAVGGEDLGSARYLLFFGTNQAETHPVTFAHLLRCRESTGASLVVIDPRKTATAAYADRWLAPKPHTDLAIVLAMISHILKSDLHDRDFVKRWVVGFQELAQHVETHGYTPEWAAGVADVPAAEIRRIAEEYARAEPAAIFCNAGISHQLGAFDTYRALAFLAAITGNVGVPGGGCNFMHNTWPGGLDLPPLTAATPPKREALPVGPDYFAESILTGRPYRLRALVTEGNPLLSSANTAKVREAFRKLEFYVYTGLFSEEAALYADIVLPVTSGFEMETVYMRRDDRAIRWQKQVVPRVGESKPDWEIWIDLAHAMAEVDTRRPKSDWQSAFPLAWRDYRELWDEFVRRTPGMGGMSRARMEARAEPLRWPCPDPEHPGVSTLYLDHPSWYRALESIRPDAKGKRFPTPSGKIEIHTEEIERRLAVAGHSSLPIFYTHPAVTGSHPTVRHTEELVANPVNPQALTPKAEIGVPGSDEMHAEFPLMGMIGRPSVVHFAGVTQWTYLGKQLNGERLIQIHPEAARAVDVGNGDLVRVESPSGAIIGTALLWPDMRKDTIFVPSTFGSAQEVGDEFGAPRYESANLLVDDRYFDNLSGQQAYKCFACRVVKI